MLILKSIAYFTIRLKSNYSEYDLQSNLWWRQLGQRINPNPVKIVHMLLCWGRIPVLFMLNMFSFPRFFSNQEVGVRLVSASAQSDNQFPVFLGRKWRVGGWSMRTRRPTTAHNKGTVLQQILYKGTTSWELLFKGTISEQLLHKETALKQLLYKGTVSKTLYIQCSMCVKKQPCNNFNIKGWSRISFYLRKQSSHSFYVKEQSRNSLYIN